MISDEYIECSEICGKTIQMLRIYKDQGDGTELQIDFTDGTSFSGSFCVSTVVEARLIRSGISVPEIIQKYELG